MKRIEIVMSNSALEDFRESAAHLGIFDFEAIEVRRSSSRQVERQRLYMGTPFSISLPARTKVQFSVAEQDLESIVRALALAVRPDSISILSIHQIDLTNLESV